MYIFLLIILVLLFIFIRKDRYVSARDTHISLSQEVDCLDGEDDSSDIDEYIQKQKECENNFEYFVDINRINNVPQVVQGYRKHNAKKKLSVLVQSYFDMHEKMREAKSRKDYASLIQYCQLGLSMIEPFIVEQKHSYGSFDIKGIPAIEEVLPHYAVIGARGQIENVRDIVWFFPELSPWKKEVENAERMRKIASDVYKFVKNNPDAVQKDLKQNISESDGRFISNVVYYMALHNIVLRVKKGNSYTLRINSERK